jgi:hypothetical protein
MAIRRAAAISGMVLGLMTNACGGASPASPATDVAPICQDVFHAAKTTFLGNNTFVQQPAYIEHTCTDAHGAVTTTCTLADGRTSISCAMVVVKSS